MSFLETDYGYELVPESVSLEFGEVDPKARELAQKVLDEYRRNPHPMRRETTKSLFSRTVRQALKDREAVEVPGASSHRDCRGEGLGDGPIINLSRNVAVKNSNISPTRFPICRGSQAERVWEAQEWKAEHPAAVARATALSSQVSEVEVSREREATKVPA